MCWRTLFLINCFGIEMVLCDLYLKRFDFTKSVLFDTFVNYCLVQIVSLRWLSIIVPIVFTTNKLIDRIKHFKRHASPNDFMKKMRRRPDCFHETKCAAGKTYQTKCAAGRIFWLSPHGYSILMQYVIYFPRITAQNLLLLINWLINW